MTILAHLHKPTRAAIVGASGGIGRALATQLAEAPACETLYAFGRTAPNLDQRNVVARALDYADPSGIERAAKELAEGGPLDLVIVATGILHRAGAVQPEKSMAELNAGQMAEVLSVNTIGPTMVAKHFLPLMRGDSRTVFAALSARVGSISDNRLGGWLSYRVSKAALNMALKTLAIEQARKRPQCLVVGLHPGTVKTELSRPFTRSKPEHKLFTPERAARQLLEVIGGLRADASGSIFAWDGKPIPF